MGILAGGWGLCGSYWYSEVLILSFDKMCARPDFKVILYSDENLAFFLLFSPLLLTSFQRLFCLELKILSV